MHQTLVQKRSDLQLGLSGGTSGKFRKDPGSALRASPGIPLDSSREYGWDPPKHYNSMHLKPPEHFQNCLPLSTAGDASFFRIGSGEGLSELVMELPAVLRAFLIIAMWKHTPLPYTLNVQHSMVKSQPPPPQRAPSHTDWGHSSEVVVLEAHRVSSCQSLGIAVLGVVEGTQLRIVHGPLTG